jgi:amino acid adenylation domain-containing protein
MPSEEAAAGVNPVMTAFERFAALKGERQALVAGGSALTYAQLSLLTHKLAERLQARSSLPGEPVLVLLEDDLSRCAALFAAQLAGQAFIPLDPRNPPARLAPMLQGFPAASLVFDRRTSDLAHRLAGLTLVNLDELESVDALTAPTPVYDPQALAWIIFTSGTTGQPKGVMQSYRNCAFYIRQAVEALTLQPGARYALASPLTSHAGVVSALSVLSSGGTLFFIEPGRRSAGEILDWIAAQRITVLLIAPTLFQRMLDGPHLSDQLHTLRFLRLTGEPVTAHDIDLFNRFCHPDCVLSVGYSTSETAGITQAYYHHPASAAGQRVSVGRLQPDVQVSLIDGKGRPVAVGEPGEIVVKSAYLSPGYWDMPEQTRQVFSDLPDGRRQYRTGDLGILHVDGTLEHIGRVDSQIKILGQRVELSEIEYFLRSVPYVREAAVHPQRMDSGEWRLHAFVNVDQGSAHSSAHIRQALAEMLPDYMLPHEITVLDSLPLTRTGKIDRQALAEIVPDSIQAHEVAEPRGETELHLARIWSEVLGIPQVGRDMDFLALGGDSLRAVQVISRIRLEFRLDLSLRDVLDVSTIAGLARLVDGKR